jgi:hypothetical protein
MIYVNAGPAIQALKQTAADLDQRNFTKAVSRALNETILQGRTTARRKVKDIYNIPQKNLTGINIDKAKSNSLVAKLFASASPIPMDAFSPVYITQGKSISVTRKGLQKVKGTKSKVVGGGVSIEVLKGNRETVPYAFMVAGAKPRVFARGEYRQGGQFGFVRRNKRVNSEGNDIPIKPLLSVTVHAAVVNKVALKEIETKVNDVFPAIMARNIAFLLKAPGT